MSRFYIATNHIRVQRGLQGAGSNQTISSTRGPACSKHPGLSRNFPAIYSLNIKMDYLASCSHHIILVMRWRKAPGWFSFQFIQLAGVGVESRGRILQIMKQLGPECYWANPNVFVNVRFFENTYLFMGRRGPYFSVERSLTDAIVTLTVCSRLFSTWNPIHFLVPWSKVSWHAYFQSEAINFRTNIES